MRPFITKSLYVALLAVVGTPACAESTSQPDPTSLFDPIGNVVMHPRCLNCHQTEAPHQTDAVTRHTQNVVRGADGLGAPSLNCLACHQAANSPDGKVPGAPHWHLAPLTMSWAGLSKGQICAQLKDPQRNGNRVTADEVIAHMKDDPLVLWAWNPGAGRSTPVMSHSDFVKALQVWVSAGMPCPQL
jgi:hypothetical protein